MRGPVTGVMAGMVAPGVMAVAPGVMAVAPGVMAVARVLPMGRGMPLPGVGVARSARPVARSAV
jgi:hypothetical protein